MFSTEAQSIISPGYQRSAPKLRHVRVVWAAVTRTPSASLDELRTVTGLPITSIGRALHALRFAGYIDFDEKCARGRAVLVPFAFIPAVRHNSDAPG